MPQPAQTDRRALFCKIFAWGLATLAVGLALVTWGQDHGWRLSGLSGYEIFPVLGLIAYTIMWSHYVSSVIRRLLGVEMAALKQYFQVTRFIVLACICLHPGILIYRLFRDGQGLPPGSYMRYVAPGLGWITLLGTVSFFIFMAYELRPFFSKKLWWKYVTFAGDAAMVAIFYHGLRIGSDLQGGWFMKLWWFYGLTLIGCLAYNYFVRFKRAQKKSA